ncbi:hypothetical protein IW140_002823 [Coemansia sp. RSA 1813]|nr:hypothetical protein EV178_002743 [Coemansia sp. RSA 1646]KAJ1770102.1 hypothetical protein LPJ74_003463 [Coemansia sp. RSA 1843]KAJ2089860.1 hypothetical protein IW138_003154 [Coemansia sp. RSA 986]KAJ2214755.1 hypothetical protein EV179_002703 [Coemansia sp. RSA 487]KAJ2569742.1 hypothetical protein IW140_002823 [Coemansia sp. RSA 1813]
MESRVFHNTRHTEKTTVYKQEPRLASATIDRETVQAELVVGYPPFFERYTSQVAIERPWRITATAAPNGGIFKHMKTVWEFAETRSDMSSAPSGLVARTCSTKEAHAQTLVRFTIEYEFVSVLHAQAASLVFDKMAKTNLAAYLDRCRELYDK